MGQSVERYRVKRLVNKLYNELARNPVAIVIAVASIAITIFFGVLGIYLQKENKAEVTFEIIRNLNVLSLKKDVENLEILFRKEDIVKKGLSLKIVSVKVANTGDRDIKQADFDKNNPWTIEIANSEIISATSILTSDDYLKIELKKLYIGEGYIEIPFLMFDKGKSFIIEALILHKKSIPLNPIISGKISGMDDFTIATKTLQNRSELHELLMAFQGDGNIQFARVSVYFVVFVIYLFCFVHLIKKFKRIRKRRIVYSRRKNIDQHLKDILINDPSGEIIADVYLSSGKVALEKLRDHLSPNILKFSALASKVEVDYYRYSELGQRVVDPIFTNPNLSSAIGAAIRSLMDNSLIYKNGEDWILNKKFGNLLDKAIERLL